ncbi:helix-turn-helix transcriptional regulator [uncultured Lactobacillus sp.]|uniref:helix-turn-helix domain-containing protein n=1 Tax=uncultured Lactobacillus sp. TaxID=153152 RepID=UPI0028037C89|nr:helix-turn-helix transcriptional regulator [uncultured Lactobacillus sp.]
MRLNLDLKNDDERKLDKLFKSFQFNIAQQILAARLSQGLTREQVSQKLNMDESEYADIEHGQNFQMSEEQYNKILKKVQNINNSCLAVEDNLGEFSFENKYEKRNVISNLKVRVNTNVNSIQPEWV